VLAAWTFWGCSKPSSGASGTQKSDAAAEVGAAAQKGADGGGAPDGAPPKKECSADGWCEIMKVKKGNLFGIWGVDPHNVYALWGGVLVQEHDLEWSVVPTGGQRMYAVRGLGLGDLWTVGDSGNIWHSSPQWTHYQTENHRDLRGVAIESADSVWAVGEGGTIAHFDGKAWKLSPSGTAQDLIAVWAFPSGEVWAVGENGTALQRIKDRWEAANVPSKAPLGSIWGAAPNDIWAVGGLGTLVHYDGKQWRGGVPVTTKDLFAVWGTSPKDVWAVGAEGTILHYDGNTWGNSPSGSDYEFHGVWGNESTDMWVVGASHKTGQTATLRRRYK
jgi:hypothetical protein